MAGHGIKGSKAFREAWASLEWLEQDSRYLADLGELSYIHLSELVETSSLLAEDLHGAIPPAVAYIKEGNGVIFVSGSWRERSAVSRYAGERTPCGVGVFSSRVEFVDAYRMAAVEAELQSQSEQTKGVPESFGGRTETHRYLGRVPQFA